MPDRRLQLERRPFQRAPGVGLASDVSHTQHLGTSGAGFERIVQNAKMSCARGMWCDDDGEEEGGGGGGKCEAEGGFGKHRNRGDAMVHQAGRTFNIRDYKKLHIKVVLNAPNFG